MHVKIFASAAFLFALSGCLGAEALQQASTGYVGCPADEIAITNDNAGFNQRSWDASCRGHLYHCSGVGKTGMSCVEDRGSAAGASQPNHTEATRREVPRHLWQRFEAKDCGVAVDLPGEPEERRPTGRGTARGGAYTAMVDVDDGAVAIGCQPRPKGADEGRLFDSARDGALAEIGATFASEFDIEAGGFRGRETQFVVGAEHGRLRTMMRSGEVITMVLVPTRAFSKQEANRFFQSLGDSATQIGTSTAAASAP